ncbi:MAG: glycoside hydrolase family 172 protein [Bacteroidota bacterium]
MKSMENLNKTFITLLLIVLFTACASESGEKKIATDNEVRNVSWFLERLRTVDHLPVLEDSHTAMISTWDTTGYNLDAYTHNRKIEGNANTILDIDGPGCIHRIFTGMIDERFDSTIIQIYLDHNETPLFDMPISEFFNEKTSPIPYPLVFVKTYPGLLLPIPFEKNIKVKIVTRPFREDDWNYGQQAGADWNRGRWGVFWQFVYTKYEDGVRVKSLNWPLDEDEQAELDNTLQAWLKAESSPPPAPEQWTREEKAGLAPGESLAIGLKNAGVIQQMRITARPDSPEVLNKLKLRIYWDGCELPSVDVPVGYMFGHGETGHGMRGSSIGAVMGRAPIGENVVQEDPQEYNTNYHSLLLGMTDEEVYCMFPMPFSEGAKIELVNTGSIAAEQVEIKLDMARMKEIPENWGRFQVTWSREPAATGATPKFGPQNVPGKVFLERRGRGKYVGSMLQVEWPFLEWWGEGDWLFWTDEDGWPPSYHGTGSEEYFNSGWCMFDRKAVSGFVSLRPGYPTVYSFHLNDAFNFQKSIKVVEEQWKWGADMSEVNPMWSSTAFWYSAVPTGAESMQ